LTRVAGPALFHFDQLLAGARVFRKVILLLALLYLDASGEVGAQEISCNGRWRFTGERTAEGYLTSQGSMSVQRNQTCHLTINWPRESTQRQVRVVVRAREGVAAVTGTRVAYQTKRDFTGTDQFTIEFRKMLSGLMIIARVQLSVNVY
jgi:hypothetical protein